MNRTPCANIPDFFEKILTRLNKQQLGKNVNRHQNNQ